MSFEAFAIGAGALYLTLVVVGIFVNAIFGPAVRRRRWRERSADELRYLRDHGGTDYTEDE